MRLFFATLCLLLPAALTAQTCDLFYPQKPGTVLTYAMTNGKGKPEGTFNHTIKAKEGAVYTISISGTDDKGKPLPPFEYKVKCTSGEFEIDMQSMMGSLRQSGMPESMTLTAETSFLLYPGELAVGATLPEGTMTTTLSQDGQAMGTMRLRIYNRRVTGQETVTTPAGSFTAYVLEEETEVKTEMQIPGMPAGVPMPNIPPIVSKTTTYISRGTGMVKNISYDRSGKPEITTVLSAIK